MRWIIVALIALNLLLFGVQWVQYQERVNDVDRDASVADESPVLQLLSEVLLEPEESPEGEGGAVEEGKPCLLVGPLVKEAGASSLQEQLAKIDIETSMHIKTSPRAPEYWVYVPPLDTRRAAITYLAELKARKIDSYLIAQGPLRNGISLGLFRNIDSAERLLEQRKEQKIPAEVREVKKESRTYWLQSDEKANMQLAGRIRGLLAEFNPEIGVRQIFCKSVASANDLP